MPLQRMLAGGVQGIRDLESAVNAPGGDGRGLLVQGSCIDPHACKRKIDKKNDHLGLCLPTEETFHLVIAQKKMYELYLID